MTNPEKEIERLELLLEDASTTKAHVRLRGMIEAYTCMITNSKQIAIEFSGCNNQQFNTITNTCISCKVSKVCFKYKKLEEIASTFNNLEVHFNCSNYMED